MKILESYKKIAKSMLIEHAWDRKFGEPLPTLEDVMKEAESMKLQPKGGGKTVVFKDKDNYEKAKKSGDYEDPEGPGDGGEKEEPTGKLGGGDFDRDSEGEKDEPEGGEPEDAEKRMAQIDKERESLSRQYNRLDQPGADKSGEGKAKVMKKWDALDAEYDELEKSVGDEPEGEPPEDMSDEELGDAAQQASDEYDIARRKADDVAMRTGNTDSDEHKAAEAAYTKVTDLENEMKKRKASAQAVSALGSDGSDEQAENLYQLVKTPEDRDDPVLGKEHEVESDDGDYTYDSPGWEIVQNIAVKARNSDDPAETFKKEFENAPPEVQEYILANIGKGKAESIKVINGKKYRPIKESVEPKKHLLREMYERIGGK
jgi:hypothetical protein